MKITSIKVATADRGMNIEVGLFVASNEELDESDIARLHDALKEFGDFAERPTASLETAAAAAEQETATEKPQEAPEPVLGRRRRGSAAAPTAAPQAESEPVSEAPTGRRRKITASFAHTPFREDEAAGEPHTPVTAPDQAPTGRRRRAAPAAQENPSATPSTEPQASQGRRRRAVAEPATTTATAAPAATTSETGRRRRVASTASTESAPAASAADDIKDADLMKAASEGARVLTPKVVKDILADLGVNGVQELKGSDRRKFLDTVKAKIASAQ